MMKNIVIKTYEAKLATSIPPGFWGGLVENNFGEGNGTPLQYSCLENPMDGEAW